MFQRRKKDIKHTNLSFPVAGVALGEEGSGWCIENQSRSDFTVKNKWR